MLSYEIPITNCLEDCLLVLLTLSSAFLSKLEPMLNTLNVKIQPTVLLTTNFEPADRFEQADSNRQKPNRQFLQLWPELFSKLH